MHTAELVGYLASALVFATFYMKTMMPLRAVAIASNVAFISYGTAGWPRSSSSTWRCCRSIFGGFIRRGNW